MLPDTERSRLIAVTAAATIVLLLAGLLVARLVATDANAMSTSIQSDVPTPTEATWDELEIPCWSCPKARSCPMRFRTNLDLIAPLGTGGRNAAEFFAQFNQVDGTRADEAKAFMLRQKHVEGFEDYGNTVAFDDPLLLEAEPWVDQASMRFYPDVFPIEGMHTRIPHLLMTIAFARTWTVRGVTADDPSAGLEDCRRAIRLGRLLRQEDFLLINDLVGLACIHIGTRGIYDIAQSTGDTDLALVASIILGEVAPQRLYSAQRVTRADLSPYVRQGPDGEQSLEAPDHIAERIFEMVTSNPDNRFRGEATMGALTLLRYGTAEQQQQARAVLEEMAEGSDPRFAELARWSLANQDEILSLEELWREERP